MFSKHFVLLSNPPILTLQKLTFLSFNFVLKVLGIVVFTLMISSIYIEGAVPRGPRACGDRPEHSQEAPRAAQERPEGAEDGPKDAPKTRPRAAKTRPRAA